MSSESFEEMLERACRDRDVAGAVMFAESKDGKFRYEKAIGYRSLKDPSNPDPMPIDATMWLASCTKLPTTVAAMQCVEKGLLNLDEDVSTILPELKDKDILTGFENDPDGKEKPILVKNTKTITLRHLLTHTSGISYDVFNPALMRFRATQGKAISLQIGGPLIEAFNYPLVFSPGESWDYGVGIDYAGWMVERVNGGISLEEYLNKNVWGPLGVKSMCFHPKQNPTTMSKMTDMSEREGGPNMFGTPANPDGKMRYTDNRVWNMETQGCAGGAGGYGAPRDYHRLLQSILTDDEKVLKRSTVEEMFKPQLNEAGRNGFMNQLKIPEVNDAMGGWPLGTKLDWGIGGALVMQDLVGRKKGSMCWGGYPNLIWWIDREGGMAGIFGSQSIYPGDRKILEFFYSWEQTVYERAQKHKL